MCYIILKNQQCRSHLHFYELLILEVDVFSFRKWIKYTTERNYINNEWTEMEQMYF